jgi:hypothetical protein
MAVMVFHIRAFENEPDSLFQNLIHFPFDESETSEKCGFYSTAGNERV